ncbi:aldose epimerase family protein [Yoonia sp. BS5-3]|uniref:Aldose epimerase family protein n=1 Tax=Yoonia phaeophyticola TaxID=3137369 RepID=A0ABZ2V333_9RHOB
MTLFGKTQDGQDVHVITLRAGDIRVNVLTWGAAIQDVRIDGVDRSLTLGSDKLQDYEGTMGHHGTLIGPIANRISTARVRLDGMMFELERNQDGRIHLHSGADATHRQVWKLRDQSADRVTLTLDLADGACGLPGNRQIDVTYRVSAPATLTMEVTGTTDSKTCMNFANHSYWNLDGGDSYTGHHLQINADHYLPITDDACPTGEIAAVDGTPMDFRQGQRLGPDQPALDHNFCLSDAQCDLRDVLHLTGQSGITMRLGTTQAGLQIYDGRGARRPGRPTYEGLAIEAQDWPDAPNNPAFPSIIITPEKPYRQMTRWSFQR